MTGRGKRGRPQTATLSERGFRSFLREEGFMAEAVPFIRAQDNEHTAVVLWNIGAIADFWRLFQQNPMRLVEVTRVRFPRPGVRNVRVFLRWMTMEEAVMDSKP